MNKSVILFSVLAAALSIGLIASSTQTHSEFDQWKAKFGMRFSESENMFREMVFNKNLEMILAHNQNKERTYDMGVNQFTHLTQEEFVNTYLNPKRSESTNEFVDTSF